MAKDNSDDLTKLFSDRVAQALRCDRTEFRYTPQDTIEYRLTGSKSWVEIPDLRMEAPRYELERRENHDGMGYHAHIRMLKSGRYIRSGHLITICDGVIFGVNHGRGGDTLFDLARKKNSVVLELNLAFREFERYKDGKDWLPVPSAAIEVYRF